MELSTQNLPSDEAGLKECLREFFRTGKCSFVINIREDIDDLEGVVNTLYDPRFTERVELIMPHFFVNGRRICHTKLHGECALLPLMRNIRIMSR